MEDHVPRHAQMGAWVLINDRWYYLTHVFGRGLADDRYVVERFKSMTNGDIRPLHAGRPGKKGRRQARARRIYEEADF